MNIDGDIKVWTDGKKACARLQADGPEGPIVVQASAPLGPIRRRLMRVLARRGVSVGADDTSTRATLERVARQEALGRLRTMAPGAFAKGGLASYVARKMLLKRKRRRRALARAGNPVGAKAIGPVPANPMAQAPAMPWPTGKRRRRRRRRLGRWTRRFPQLMQQAARPSLAPIMSAPSSALAKSPAGPAPQSSAASNDVAPVGPARSASAQEEDAPADEGEYGDEPEQQEEPEEVQAEDGGTDDEAADESESDEEQADEKGSSEDVGADPAPKVERRHVGQAMTLLNAAKQSLAARRRVKKIAKLAKGGDPTAKKALAALKVANKLQNKSKARPALPPVAAAKPSVALITTANQIAASASPSAPGTSALRRWLDIFASWRRGVG